jgi:hypothetical protein
MKSALFRALAFPALSFLGVAMSSAQGGGWAGDCLDPSNMQPYSNDYGLQGQENALVGFTIGVSGTVTYGGSDNMTPDPCYDPARTLSVRGRFSFGSGVLGSVQSTFDDFLGWTVGYDLDPHFAYATTNRDGTRTLFGQNAYAFIFNGASDRYIRARTTNDGVQVDLRMDVLGDAVRMQWDLTNTDAASHTLGLWFGAWTGMASNEVDPNTGANFSGIGHFTGDPPLDFVGGKNGYVMVPNGRPPRTDQRYNRANDPSNFPEWCDFLFGQSMAFGMRIENGPSKSTVNNAGASDANQAQELVLGNYQFLLGGTGDNTFVDLAIDDLFMLGAPAFIQKFDEQTVPTGSTRRIVHYVRSTWAESNYSPPYCVVVDPPRLLAPDPNGINQLTPNPFRLRVYIDNVAGYSTVNQEVPLADVKITLGRMVNGNFVVGLPAGLTPTPGHLNQKVITSIPAKAIDFVEWEVEADGQVYGEIEYAVRVQPVPGPTKIITDTIQISTTPRLVIRAGANLLTAPWIFSDSSWETVLQLNRPADFQAFTWDPQQLGYIISTAAERGKGAWIIASADFGSRQLGGNPQDPNDARTDVGAPATQLRFGWNLIGNPYPYAMPLGHIVGVSGAINQQAFTWQNLVTQGLISGSLAYWDTDTQSYKFIQGNEALMQPNLGYWIFVFTTQDFTLKWPPIFAPGLPGVATRSRWVQSDAQWRLQLVARNQSLDDQNFIGKASNADSVKMNRIMEPPMGPTQMVAVSIEEQLNGQPTRVAQSLSDRNGRKEWKVLVDVKEAGPVTLTWPNIATVPKSNRFRITDTVSGVSRSMRQSSGYTFTMNEPGTRVFTVISEPDTGGGAVIGNVTVNGNGRGSDSAFTINYTLASAATTNVRILSGSGKEVYVALRGRADSVGENQVTWNTRDSAGRNVAPGIYRVEIVAETENGQRVRKIVPLNVTR